ncbi:MAG: STAS domain-containing protein [Actinomycetota bacterium]|nr:STAS domain-containing protein [Actinomycetota bacterium]
MSRLPGGKGLAVAGEVDLATHRNWQSTVRSLLVDDAAARLDLSGLSFIDGHGAAVLMSVAEKMAPQRTLTLYRPPLCLRRLLDLFWSEDHVVIVIEEAG